MKTLFSPSRLSNLVLLFTFLSIGFASTSCEKADDIYVSGPAASEDQIVKEEIIQLKNSDWSTAKSGCFEVALNSKLFGNFPDVTQFHFYVKGNHAQLLLGDYWVQINQTNVQLYVKNHKLILHAVCDEVPESMQLKIELHPKPVSISSMSSEIEKPMQNME